MVLGCYVSFLATQLISLLYMIGLGPIEYEGAYIMKQVGTSLLALQIIVSQIMTRTFVMGYAPAPEARLTRILRNLFRFTVFTSAVMLIVVTVMLPYVDMMVAWLCQLFYFFLIHLSPLLVCLGVPRPLNRLIKASAMTAPPAAEQKKDPRMLISSLLPAVPVHNPNARRIRIPSVISSSPSSTPPQTIKNPQQAQETIYLGEVQMVPSSALSAPLQQGLERRPGVPLPLSSPSATGATFSVPLKTAAPGGGPGPGQNLANSHPQRAKISVVIAGTTSSVTADGYLW